MTPSLSFNSKYFRYSLGPKIWILSRENQDNFGADLNMQFYPNPKSKVVNFYFLSHLEYVHSTLTQSGNLITYVGDTNRTIQSEFAFHSIDKESGLFLYLGYGFKIKIYKNLFINQFIAIGIGRFHSHKIESVPEYTKLDYDKIQNYHQPALLANFTIGFR